MLIRVLYFAGVRDLVGRREEALELPRDIDTIARLRAHLAERHPALGARLPSVRFARNERFAEDGDALEPGDEIALVPPVSGG